MVVAGAILTEPIPEITDSKKLSSKKREALYTQIIQHPHHIVIIPPEIIDRDGISHGLQSALHEIMATLKAERYLFDGNTSFGIENLTHQIKADRDIQEVGAASILAKVTKDRELLRVGKAFPEYDFASHQGYLTAKHIQELKTHGRSTIHRQSYKIKALESSLFSS